MNANDKSAWDGGGRTAAGELAADAAIREACEAKLLDAWAAIDETPAYPCTVETAASLLRARGYDVTATCLAGWAAAPGMIDYLEHTNGKVRWAAASIVGAMAHCERQRRWIPLHPLHLGKCTDVEAAEAQAVALGETIFNELDCIDCRSILATLVAAREHKDRIVLGQAFAAKLRHLDVLEK